MRSLVLSYQHKNHDHAKKEYIRISRVKSTSMSSNLSCNARRKKELQVGNPYSLPSHPLSTQVWTPEIASSTKAMSASLERVIRFRFAGGVNWLSAIALDCGASPYLFASCFSAEALTVGTPLASQRWKSMPCDAKKRMVLGESTTSRPSGGAV